MVKPDQLAKPDESLTEKMRKLVFSLQEGERTLTLLMTHIQYPLPYIVLHNVCSSPFIEAGGGCETQNTVTVSADTPTPDSSISSQSLSVSTEFRWIDTLYSCTSYQKVLCLKCHFNTSL